MPYQTNNKIASLLIMVNDIQNNPAFVVYASENAKASQVGDPLCTGDAGDADLLKEILDEAIAKFPGRLMSLCIKIDDKIIVRKVHCAAAAKPKSAAAKPETKAAKPKH